VHLRRLAIVALVVGFLALLTYGLLSKGTDDRIDQALASGRAPEAPHFSLEALEPGTVPPNLARSVGTALSGNRVALSLDLVSADDFAGYNRTRSGGARRFRP